MLDMFVIPGHGVKLEICFLAFGSLIKLRVTGCRFREHKVKGWTQLLSPNS